MRTTNFLNYFNLIVGIILLWPYIRSGPMYHDYYFVAGLGVVIWYNWETRKQLRGQKNKLNRLNYAIGILTLLFALLMILAALGMIKEGLGTDNKGQIALGTIWILLGLTTITLTL